VGSCDRKRRDGLFEFAGLARFGTVREKIDQSLSIVAETALNPNRANSPLKSKAKNFDGLAVGFRPSEEIFCAEKSARYHDLK
jgi:hypothetical protein